MRHKPKEYRPGLPEMPEYVKRLRVFRGYPVPYFVRWEKGVAEFRLSDPQKVLLCIKQKRCWVCGVPLPIGATPATFVGGTMMAYAKVSAEPPSHPDCARFAAKACPFLVMPQMERRRDNMPPAHDPPGVALPGNPGVVVLWSSLWNPVQVEGGITFNLMHPIALEFYRQGREATLDEVREAFEEAISRVREAELSKGPRADISVLADISVKKKVAMGILGL